MERPSPDQQHIRLACQACQRKKIKCDRSFPCGQCQRSGLPCAPSTRKPRTRHSGKRAVDSELRTRISKLESLVESLSGEVGSIEDDVPDLTPPESNAVQADEARSPTVGRYIGSPFWSSLSAEVQALRDALEDDPDEEDPESMSPTTSNSGPQAPSSDYNLIMCPPGAIYVMPGALVEPPPQAQSILYGIYINNVAPLFNTFHTPTLRAFLERGVPYLGLDANEPPNKLVKAAIWFSAVNTMADADCRQRLGQPKAELFQQYRRSVEVLFVQADIMVTTDIATLQALVTYLVTVRSNDLSRRTWTMTALVVRIARAMGLDRESPGRTPYEQEIRRRLWHQVRFLDVFTAIDRGAQVLISLDSYDTLRPSNVNNSDFDESSTFIVPHESGLTDMSFGLLTHEANTYSARLMGPSSAPGEQTWQQQLEIAHNFGAVVQKKFLQYCDMNDGFHRLIYLVGQSMSAGMILRAIRPMHKNPSSAPPRIDSPYVLEIAFNALRAAERIYEDPEHERWRWQVWVQWHALSVALASLCSIRGTELADSAWPYVERMFDRVSRQVADTRNGMLWRPIDKLYKKAVAFRDAGRREAPITAPSNPPPPILPATSPALDPDPSAFAPPPPPSGPKPPVSPSVLQHYPLLTGPMDFNAALDSSSAAGTGLTDLAMPPGDMSWWDWERIMDDLSAVEPGAAGVPDLQQLHMTDAPFAWTS